MVLYVGHHSGTQDMYKEVAVLLVKQQLYC
jgi:hypothetical protein